MKELIVEEEDREWFLKKGNKLAVSLRVAYLEARRNGKRKTMDEHKFELNEDANLKYLKRDIINRTYRPGRSVAHIVHRPVIREIFAASFRDRIVHHLIYETVYEWWDRHFIYDSYSCRVGKGTLFGIRRLDHHIRSASLNYKRKVYIYKLDIRGYFMSLSRRDLFRRAIWGLDRQFKGMRNSFAYEIIRYLWYYIIMDDPIRGARKVGRLSDWNELPDSKSLFKQLPGQGIVIGNLTSQLLSNIYLDMLDRFIVFELGYKHYGRYVDDFYIVVTEEELPQLLKDVRAIEEFLKRKKLVLHPNKRLLMTSDRGVPFLGAVIHKGYIMPGERLKKSFRKACVEVQAGVKEIETLVSYLGHVEHFNKIKLVSEEFERIGLEHNY